MPVEATIGWGRTRDFPQKNSGFGSRLLGAGFGIPVGSRRLSLHVPHARLPIFFRQQRPGLHGKPFDLVKFRTMRAPKPGEDALKTDI